jgi:hypothetical protein
MKTANFWIGWLAIAAVMLTSYDEAAAAEPSAVFGRVTDSSGAPLSHATVFVYKARVRKGYSIFCPTCWVDCGKRAITNSDGTYRIDGLDPELIFQLLVVHDGFDASYLSDLDPAKGLAADGVLAPRHSVDDPAQEVLGLVVDSHGFPVRDAVIEPQEVTARGKSGELQQMFGIPQGLERLAVTNERGEFELGYTQAAKSMILRVSARGAADKLITLPTGSERTTIVVADGATIRGRLVKDGRPVAKAEIGLSAHSQRAGSTFPEMRVGTRDDGTFDISNVPAGRIYYLYAKMGSLASRGLASEVVDCETKTDDQSVNVGDIRVSAAETLRGKVLLSDGRPIPADTQILLSADRAWDSQSMPIGADGWFEFKGLSKGVYEVAPSVKGYRLPDAREPEVLVNRNVSDLIITLLPSNSE